MKRGHINPTVYISNPSENILALNVNRTPVNSKYVNLSCIPISTKSQNLNKHQKEQTITETENLDQIYMKKDQTIKIKSF